jgi:serine/threonine protein kinase
MKCFFEEGRALAKLVHPNVVRVLNFFRANGTVYMVMQFERGRTLHDYVQKNKGNVRERFIRGVFTRMLNGLREVHAHKLLHLDIKPSNIYLRADGTPVLLDFGAARQTLMSDTPILKPMYTPASPRPSSSPAAKPSARGATSTAWAPACTPAWPATRRSAPTSASSTTPSSRPPRPGPGQYSPHFLATIDWCLQLDPLKRPQSCFACRKFSPSATGRRRPSRKPGSKGWAPD